jgi:hypothetical protein
LVSHVVTVKLGKSGGSAAFAPVQARLRNVASAAPHKPALILLTIGALWLMLSG